VNRLVVLMGTKGMGKSTLIRAWADRHPRVLWLDPMLEEVAAAGAGNIAVDLDELYDLLDARAGLDRWRIVYVGEPETYGEAVAMLQPATPRDQGYARALGGVTVACGEADLLAPNSGALHPAVRALIHRGRHYGINLLAAVRRPAEVARDLTSQADLVVLFRLSEPRDLAFVRAFVGKSIAAEVSGLARFAYVTYSPGQPLDP